MHSRMFPSTGYLGASLLPRDMSSSFPSGPIPASYTLPASTASRIPAPPAWNPTLPMPPSSYIAGAALSPTAASRVGIPSPPAWQANVLSPSGAAAPLMFHAGPQPSDFVEEDEDAD